MSSSDLDLAPASSTPAPPVRPVRPAGRQGLLAPFAGREFRLLWTGLTASNVADQLSLVALAWLALQLTGSPLSVGGVLTAAALPRGLLALLGGAVSDRVGARELGVLASLARVAVMGTLALLVLTGAVRLVEVYALALLFGTADAFYAPTRQALVPSVVQPEQLEAANSLDGSTVALTSLVGPAAAGLLIARAGTGYALAGDALCFVLVAAVTFAMRPHRRPADAQPESRNSIWGDVVAGLRYAYRDPVLRTVILLAAAMNLAASGPADVGLAALARNRFGGPSALGFLFAGFGAGAVLGSLTTGLVPFKRFTTRLLGAAALFGLLMPLLGIVPTLAVALPLTVVLGTIAGQVNVVGSSWLMGRTEPALMGRVLSLMIVTSVGLSPVSLAAAGAIAQVSLPLLFLTAGGVMLAAGLAGLANRTVREA